MGIFKDSEMGKRYQEATEKFKEDRSAAHFESSPAGQAKRSYERGDVIFQTSFDLEDITSLIVWMDNAYTQRKANDVSEVLNSVARQGWNLHSMSTAFVAEGESSRDKFMMSGQQVAVRGRLVGTYVFLRRQHQPQ